MQQNIYKRLSILEAAIDKQKAEQIETLQYAYKKACEFENETLAAEMARKLRNKKLDESDKQMSFDRLGLDTSSATSFIKSLSQCFDSDWAKYRQALRDLPEQEGFPFNVTFPEPPDKN